MTNGKQLTKKQHYIPQVYLRGFSPEYEHSKGREVDKSKYTIYCYDLKNDKQYLKPIPIKSICYENNLYEVRDDKEEIVLPNYLEHVLGTLEKWFGEYRRKLEQKAFLRENIKTKSFLSKEEKAFWMTYIVIQVSRMPGMLKETEELSLELWKDKMNSNQAKNFARELCLPFFKEIKEDSIESMLIDTLIKPMLNMSFAIGVDVTGQIITGDKPIYIHSTAFPCEEYDMVIFPITSKLCLMLLGGEKKRQYRKNFLLSIDDDIAEMITKSMAEAANEKLYSNHLLNQKELCQIHDVMKDKVRR